MRTLIRAGLLLAGAAGFCLALSTVASADVVEPSSAYQPASVGLSEEETKSSMPEPANAAPRQEDKAKAKAEPKEKDNKAKPEEVAVPTPAPEQVVRQAPAHLTRPIEDSAPPSVAERVTRPLRVGLQQIGASLGRVVSACEVGMSTGAGGPVLTLAVLVMAVPFTRRRVVGTRWTADEDMPEFLYAQELTPPG